MFTKFSFRWFFLLFLFFVLGWTAARAQTTEFTYQGRLADGGQTANGNFDFEFRLFPAESGGAEIAVRQLLNVPVTAGVFSVKLDFGPNFNGQARFLEIGVRTSGSSESFTVLAPRQPFTSTPYAIQSLKASNAEQLGGIDADQFVLTTDARLADERNPVPNSPNYIQNTNTLQTANFNISGNGVLGGTLTANSVISRGNFFIVSNNSAFPVLSIAGTNNVFAGALAGFGNTTGANNSFVGARSGSLNTTGSSNSFLGSNSGGSNTVGSGNSYFGSSAGIGVITGNNNTFVGANTIAEQDNLSFATVIGAGARVSSSNTVVLGRNLDTVQIPGALNTGGAFSANTVNAATQYNIGGNRILTNAGDRNLFAGIGAGQANTGGQLNAFFGSGAGISNTNGSSNSIFGAEAGFVLTNGSGNSFFGNGAGRQTTGNNNSFFGNGAGSFSSAGNNNTAVGNGAFIGNNLSFATVIGSDALVLTSNTVVLGRTVDIVQVPGGLVLESLGAAGIQLLCRNVARQVSPCSSSLRYKTNIEPFSSGLTLIQRLRPITFDWKTGGLRDLGLGAEDVAAVEPLLVNYNDKGEVEGVKYDRLSVVLLNAVKEQQMQIEQQEKRRREQDAIIGEQQRQIKKQNEQINEQRAVIEELKQAVCRIDSAAKICK